MSRWLYDDLEVEVDGRSFTVSGHVLYEPNATEYAALDVTIVVENVVEFIGTREEGDAVALCTLPMSVRDAFVAAVEAAAEAASVAAEEARASR